MRGAPEEDWEEKMSSAERPLGVSEDVGEKTILKATKDKPRYKSWKSNLFSSFLLVINYSVLSSVSQCFLVVN